MRFVDVLLVIPHLPLMMFIIALWGRACGKIVLVIGLVAGHTLPVVRSQVISIKERRSFCVPETWAQATSPSFSSTSSTDPAPLVTQTVLGISGAILSESTLAFWDWVIHC